ncbi:MAG: MFS transporter [bacterium]
MRSGKPSFDRNYYFLLIEGILFGLSAAFRDLAAVLPVFLHELTSSMFLIGLVATLYMGGWYLPQLFTAEFFEKKQHLVPPLFKLYFWGRLPFLFLVVALLFLHLKSPSLILFLFFLSFGLFFISEGLGGVGWFELVARTVPEKYRGRFFAIYQFSAGILGFAAGFWVKAILHGSTSLETFGVLFLINLVLLALSMGFLIAIREPAQKELKPPPVRPSLIHSLPKILREDSAFRRLLLLQLLLGAATMSSPFYAIHATSHLLISPETVGYFVAAHTLGQALGCLGWGYMSDHFGNRLVIRGAILCAVVSPLLALFFHYSAGCGLLILYPLVFLFMGLAWGAWIGFTNYTMETAPEERRPTYIGILNTANAPAMLFPVLGGTLLNAASFPFLFGLTLVLLLIGFFLAADLPKPANGARHE